MRGVETATFPMRPVSGKMVFSNVSESYKPVLGTVCFFVSGLPSLFLCERTVDESVPELQTVHGGALIGRTLPMHLLA